MHLWYVQLCGNVLVQSVLSCCSQDSFLPWLAKHIQFFYIGCIIPHALKQDLNGNCWVCAVLSWSFTTGSCPMKMTAGVDWTKLPPHSGRNGSFWIKVLSEINGTETTLVHSEVAKATQHWSWWQANTSFPDSTKSQFWICLQGFTKLYLVLWLRLWVLMSEGFILLVFIILLF